MGKLFDDMAAEYAAHALRECGDVLSDEDMKVIESNDIAAMAQHILDMGPPFSPKEVKILEQAVSEKYDDNYDFQKDGHAWRDDVLDGYAEHIKNYYYTYKPEATAVDASIDPEEEHIGPMAQDIEEVNPACIIETPEGVKTVDTSRLALMNAGAIAELARQMKELRHG